MRKASFLLLLLAVEASNQEELRDLLIGASHAINHAPNIDTDEDEDTSISDTAKSERFFKRHNTKAKRRDDPDDDDEAKYGPQIVAISFGLLANTFALAADTLRITGDTAAGVLGSSIKLVGTAVKSTGSQFDNAGNWISPKTKKNRRMHTRQQHMPTSERLLHGCKRRERFIHGSRSMASRSVKLMGNVVQEFGDMILMTGAATESIGSLTASVAEESIRLLEELAESIADTKQPSKPVKSRVLVRPRKEPVNESPTVSYGSHDSTAPANSSEETEYAHSSISKALLSMFGFLNQDTGGVPSQAPELFVVFALCYLATILTFRGGQHKFEQRICIKQESFDRRRTWVWLMIALVALPFRFFIALLQWLRHLVYSRYTLLLMGYLLAWVQVCHMSQIRSKSIYSTAEAQGFRFALSSLHEVKPSVRESTVWLNTLLNQIWRVPASECPPYPDFVRDGIKACSRDPRDCIDGSCYIYGGLEPFLSWTIGNALTAALDTSRVSRPRNIAFASLQSISLGSHPPTIRHVEMLGVRDHGRKTDYLIDFDLSLEDLSLVLGIKLSSLDFALLPTTRIAVGSLVTKGQLKMTTTAIPETPFLSTVEISLAHLLDCNIRITPLGDER